MPTIRESLRRLLGTPDAVRPRPAAPDRVDYSYRVFWTKQVRAWENSLRRSVYAAARTFATSSAFEPNAFERRYRIEGVGGEHSGASVLALLYVLEAFNATD
jgi:hypothetical protein